MSARAINQRLPRGTRGLGFIVGRMRAAQPVCHTRPAVVGILILQTRVGDNSLALQPRTQCTRAHGVERIRGARALREELYKRQQVNGGLNVIAHAQRHGSALPKRFGGQCVGGIIVCKCAQHAARPRFIPLCRQRGGFIQPRLAKDVRRSKFSDHAIKQGQG
ncbi:MAG: hypothetical protein V9G23_02930 [Giesbergeria sp.]